MGYALVFLFGAILGSFLNVLIHRLPRGESIVHPGSSCPACGHRLGFFDLIPILSFLFLRARCRYCRAPISWRYPLVEAATGAAFALLFWKYGFSLSFLAFALYAALAIAIAGIDLGWMIVPDVLSLPGLGVGLVFGLLRGSFPEALIGALAGGGFMLIVYFAVLFLLKKEGLGLGDAKLLAMVGAFLGWQGALFAIFLASLLGSVVGLGLMALRRLRPGQPMPFGPYIALAGFILMVWPWQEWIGKLVVY
ncbi:MAG: prepilin peptidase [Firmicutes bacterium]|nr:prepilin peptidase [Bacillota bacterium]